jgi:hypothetical protein
MVVIESIVLSAGAPEKWRIDADPALSSGLLPGESAELRIHFRSCPEAWLGDTIDPEFDDSVCYGRISAGSIVITSNAGRYGLSLSGRGGAPPPSIEVSPQDSLQLHWDNELLMESWIWVHVINRGHAPLQIESVELVQPGSDFYFFCPACDFEASVCRFEDPTCTEPMFSVAVAFYPESGLDAQAELVIRSNDPTTPELILPVSAGAAFCAPPSPLIDHSVWFTQRDELTQFDAYASLSGSESVAQYRWSLVRGSSLAVALEGTDQRRVSFTGHEPGIYLLALEVQNTCGVWSPTPHVAFVGVRD